MGRRRSWWFGAGLATEEKNAPMCASIVEIVGVEAPPGMVAGR
jgi:hypothetical protein